MVLSVEEWDFRPIEQEPELLGLASEYEYLRSSKIRKVIEAWHKRKMSKTGLHSNFQLASAFFLTGIIDKDFRRTRREEKLFENDFDAYDRLQDQKLRRFTKLRKTDCSIGDFIGRVFKSVKDMEYIKLVLDILRPILPTKIISSHAESISLCFDLFPNPWLTLPAGYASTRASCLLPDNSNKSVLEIAHINDAEISMNFPPSADRRFIVDLSKNASNILRDFREWLECHHPGLGAGRRNQEGWLQRLAVFRLSRVEKLTFNEAMSCIADRRNKHHLKTTRQLLPLLGQSPGSWSRALRKASDDLNSDFISKIRASFAKH